MFKTDKEDVLFDIGSAVLTSHPQAEEFLRRDVSNMVRFFRKRGYFRSDVEGLVKEVLG